MCAQDHSSTRMTLGSSRSTSSSSAISASTSRTLFSRAGWVTYTRSTWPLYFLPRCTTEYTLTLCLANTPAIAASTPERSATLKRM